MPLHKGGYASMYAVCAVLSPVTGICKVYLPNPQIHIECIRTHSDIPIWFKIKGNQNKIVILLFTIANVFF